VRTTVGAERLQVERARHVEHRQQGLRVGGGQDRRMAAIASGASMTASPCRAAATTWVTVRSLPLSVIVINCSPIYN